MSLCVVAFPVFSQPNMKWIQAIRAQYDPEYRLIAPHVTFVFPTDALALPLLSERLQAVTPEIDPFTVAVRCAVPFTFGERSHLFLVPDEGFSNCIKLFNKLNACIIGSSLPTKVPFIPHITVGAFSDNTRCTQAAEQLNFGAFELVGHVDTLSIVAGTGAATVFEQIPLRGGQQNIT